MIGYQLGTAIRELFGLRFRTLLLVLQVIVVASTLSVTLNNMLRSMSDIRVAHSLGDGDVSYFTMFHDEMRPTDINAPMADLLSRTLNGESANYSIVKNNYFDGADLETPILVALGGFAQAYDLPVGAGGQISLYVGAGVTAYDVGDVITLGSNKVAIAGRLPAGVSYLDPWMGYVSLDDHVLLLGSYESFSEMTAPSFWQQEIVSRTVLFDASDDLINAFIDTAASTGGIGLIPQHLNQRISNVYEAQLARSTMFLIFFSCLLLVLLGTVVSTVDALVVSNLRRYVIERLYGAHNGHAFLRVSLFLIATFTAPTLLIFALFSVLTVNVGRIFPFVVAVVIVVHVTMSTRAVSILKRSSAMTLLRKD